jgi:protein-L-isoaspartate(D-aspartate) O-methyltransferase
MIDFAAARRMMVDGQIRTADVTDLRIIAAMLEVPRERFVPDSKAELAYLDFDIPVTADVPGAQVRHLLKSVVLAKLIQAADVQEGDTVLDVGCATGYSSAILARLAQTVVALEQEPTLARHARENLRAVSASNATVESGPLVAGWPARAPYDVIVLGGATEVVPHELFHQLKGGGRLVTILGRTPNGCAMLYRSYDGDVTGRPIFDAAEPTLPGFAEKPAFVF